MISEDTLLTLLDLALSEGGDFAEVYYESSEINRVLMQDTRVKSCSYGNTIGAGVRVIKGEQIGYGCASSVELEPLKRAALTAARIAKDGKRFSPQDLHRSVIPTPPMIERPSGEVPASEKTDFVKRVDRSARDVDARIKDVDISYYDQTRHFIIANSEGVLAEDGVVYTTLRVRTLAIDGQKRHPGLSGCSGHRGWELFDDSPPETLGRESADMAIRMLDAREAPAGPMPVIIGKGNAVIIHEAVGHGLEADIVQKGRSVYGDKLGEVIASPLVTIVDDPTRPFKGGSIRVDDEGTLAQSTLLVENGVLQGFLYDRITAQRAGTASTGNGRRQSSEFYPIPRMTNTCFLEGDDDPEEILGETARGFYVKKIGGGQVNPASGDFVFEVLEGWLVENGRLLYPLREASLIGNGLEILQNIDRVGNDFGFDRQGGFCGKGQLVPVGFGQPTIRVKKMTIGGTKK